MSKRSEMMQLRIKMFHELRARKQSHVKPIDVTLVVKVGVDKTFLRTKYRLNRKTRKVEEVVTVVHEHEPSIITAYDSKGKKVAEFSKVIDTNRFHVVAMRYA